MFIAKHNEGEEAKDLEQRRRAAVVAQPAERRHRRLKSEANRVELRGVTSMQPPDAAVTPSRLATPRGADTDLSGARELGSASTLGMFSPAGSSGVESAGEPGPSTAQSTPMRRMLQNSTAAIKAGTWRRRIMRTRVLLRSTPYVAKSLSRTLCVRLLLLISRLRR